MFASPGLQTLAREPSMPVCLKILLPSSRAPPPALAPKCFKQLSPRIHPEELVVVAPFPVHVMIFLPYSQSKRLALSWGCSHTQFRRQIQAHFFFFLEAPSPGRGDPGQRRGGPRERHPELRGCRSRQGPFTGYQPARAFVRSR